MNKIDRTVKIYALVNTLDGSVFYIGATVQRLEARLSGHVNNQLYSKKSTFIYNIYKSGGKVEIFELDSCEYDKAGSMEQFYMDLFRSYGFTLIQGRNSNYNELKPLIRARGEMHWRYNLTPDQYRQVSNPYNL